MQAHYNLGNALLAKGQAGEAIAQLEQALALDPASPAVQDNLAWALATAPQTSLRDGPRALQLATRTAKTGGGSPARLRTLAAAYAADGQFPTAAKIAQEALQLARAQSNAALAAALDRELKLYEAGRAFETGH
jgi:tetratricopeptide (TPR) repeat protein